MINMINANFMARLRKIIYSQKICEEKIDVQNFNIKNVILIRHKTTTIITTSVPYGSDLCHIQYFQTKFRDLLFLFGSDHSYFYFLFSKSINFLIFSYSCFSSSFSRINMSAVVLCNPLMKLIDIQWYYRLIYVVEKTCFCFQIGGDQIGVRSNIEVDGEIIIPKFNIYNLINMIVLENSEMRRDWQVLQPRIKIKGLHWPWPGTCKLV